MNRSSQGTPRLVGRLFDSDSRSLSGSRSLSSGFWRDLSGGIGAFTFVAVLANVVEEFTAFEWSLWGIQAILALSLTFVWGHGGIFSFGQAAIYGIGGYTYGFWAVNFFEATGETFSALAAAVVVGSGFAALLGYFMFYGNVTDVYVAIITLATSLVLFAFVNSTSGSRYKIGDAPFGGYNGMTQIPRLSWRLPGGESQVLSRVQFLLFVVAAGLMIALLIRVMVRFPFGRVAVALQHNELRTELLGYDVRWHKLAVFTVGGAIAGFGGALFAAWGRFISPPVFALTPAALVVIWVLVGGRTSVVGAFVGVLVVEGLSSWFGGASGDNEPIIFGVIMIVIVLGLPGGIVPSTRRLVSGIRDRLSPARELDINSPSGPESDLLPALVGVQLPFGMATSNGDEVLPAAMSVNSVSKRFGGLTALNHVSLEFPSTGVSCLIGPNGAGKTTLFGVLSGRLAATEGSVCIGGQDLTNWQPHQRARAGVGIKLQVASIYKELSVRENLWLACYAIPRNRELAEQRSVELLEWLRLSAESDHPAGTLSHGKQQWLEIGMVVACEPRLVLLDEPTAGMTRQETAHMGEIVTQLGCRACVIVVEHDMEFVRQLDAPITVLHMGEVFLTGSFDQLSNDERVVDIYLGRESAHDATC